MNKNKKIEKVRVIANEGRGKEIKRLAKMLGEGRSFEVIEEQNNTGKIQALRFEFDITTK